MSNHDLADLLLENLKLKAENDALNFQIQSLLAQNLNSSSQHQSSLAVNSVSTQTDPEDLVTPPSRSASPFIPVIDSSHQTDMLDINNIHEELRQISETAVKETGYNYDERTGLYFHSDTGYFYDPTNQLFYEPSSGVYLKFNDETGAYDYHSFVDERTRAERYVTALIECGMQPHNPTVPRNLPSEIVSNGIDYRQDLRSFTKQLKCLRLVLAGCDKASICQPPVGSLWLVSVKKGVEIQGDLYKTAVPASSIGAGNSGPPLTSNDNVLVTLKDFDPNCQLDYCYLSARFRRGAVRFRLEAKLQSSVTIDSFTASTVTVNNIPLAKLHFLRSQSIQSDLVNPANGSRKSMDDHQHKQPHQQQHEDPDQLERPARINLSPEPTDQSLSGILRVDLQHLDRIRLADIYELVCHIHAELSEVCAECEPASVKQQWLEDCSRRKALQDEARLEELERAALMEAERCNSRKMIFDQIRTKYKLHITSQVKEVHKGRDRAAERRMIRGIRKKAKLLLSNPNSTKQKNSSQNNTCDDQSSISGPDPLLIHRPISAENKGSKMLRRMGWKEGTALGAVNLPPLLSSDIGDSTSTAAANHSLLEPLPLIGQTYSDKSGLGFGGLTNLPPSNKLDSYKKMQQRMARLT